MAAKTSLPVEVRYRFEKFAGCAASPLAGFVNHAAEVASQAPWTIPRLPFGTSAGVSSGVLESHPAAPAGDGYRLRSIELAGRQVLENRYDSEGNLLNTVFPDGQTVRYRHGPLGRLEHVTHGRDREIQFEYDSHGRIVAALFGPAPRSACRYEWLPDGRLCGVECAPDIRLRYRRDRAGQLTSIDMSGACVSFGGNVRIDMGGRSASIPLSSGRGMHEMQTYKPGAGNPAVLVGPLGVFSVDDNRLLSGVNWNGEFSKFEYELGGRIQRIWTLQGATAFDYDADGRLVSIFRPDGHRWLWHRTDDPSQAMVLDATGASLLQYDDGRLRNVRNSWGAAARFHYGLLNRHGFPVRIDSTALGRIRLSFNPDASIDSLAIPGKGRVSFTYETSRRLKLVSWKSTEPDGARDLLNAAGWLWGLLGHRINNSPSFPEWLPWLVGAV